MQMPTTPATSHSVRKIASTIAATIAIAGGFGVMVGTSGSLTSAGKELGSVKSAVADGTSTTVIPVEPGDDGLSDLRARKAGLDAQVASLTKDVAATQKALAEASARNEARQAEAARQAALAAQAPEPAPAAPELTPAQKCRAMDFAPRELCFFRLWKETNGFG